ncbi:MAG TPA: hypothetical protein VK284_09315 [Streptosporangiaceae bacterium]|nr:hypothetical protein [Streptosporangiaceae bacterium]HLN68868.1 hypothetical protein [Streptosporangiaceae bacterium]
MCRLFGLTSGTVPVQATFWLLDAPDSLEAQSHRNADGSGIGFFGSDGAPVLDKQPEPAFSDEEFIREARQAESATSARSFGGRDHRAAGPAGPPARRQPEHRHLSTPEHT